MNLGESRIGRFVQAARSLMIAQVVVAVLAVGLSIWAFVEVRGLAAERDRLQAQVAELEGERAASEALSPGLPAETLPVPEVGKSEVPFAIPVPVPMTDPNAMAPVEPVEPMEPVPELPKEDSSPAPDCQGDDASHPRCLPGRWTRPESRRPPVGRPVPVPDRPDVVRQRPRSPN